MRFTAIALLVCYALRAQEAPKPVFEAASIKMTAPSGGGGHSHERDDPGMLRASMTLKSYIVNAYGVANFQVTGGPKWIDDSTYDIVAKLEDAKAPLPANLTPHERSQAERERLNAALRALLADRFQLRLHHETKEMPAYALEVAKSGFKLSPAAETEHAGTNSHGDGNQVKFTATAIDMGAFAAFLTRSVHLPVSNQTGIEGVYSFTLEWTPDDLKAAAEVPVLPSLFTVIEQQLGLKLQARKAPVDILVVDNAERPSEN
jgi:uncharacterized protein (TIGR03435 family)